MFGCAEVTVEIHRDGHGGNRRQGTGFLRPIGRTLPDFPLVALGEHLDGQGGGGSGQDGALGTGEIDEKDALGAVVLEGFLRGRFIGVEGMVPDQGEDRSEEQDAGEEVAGGYDASWTASGEQRRVYQKRGSGGKGKMKNPRILRAGLAATGPESYCHPCVDRRRICVWVRARHPRTRSTKRLQRPRAHTTGRGPDEP